MTPGSHLRNRTRLLILAGLALLLLAACGGPRSVRFDSDARILRGAWQGTVPDYPAAGKNAALGLDLNAVYVDVYQYDFSGAMILAGESGFTVEGKANGGSVEEYFRAQTPAELPAGFDANIRNAEGEMVFRLCGLRFPEESSYWVTLEPATEPLDLGGSFAACAEQLGYNFDLERSAE